jgi:hypothetical protein
MSATTFRADGSSVGLFGMTMVLTLDKSPGRNHRHSVNDCVSEALPAR